MHKLPLTVRSFDWITFRLGSLSFKYSTGFLKFSQSVANFTRSIKAIYLKIMLISCIKAALSSSILFILGSVTAMHGDMIGNLFFFTWKRFHDINIAIIVREVARINQKICLYFLLESTDQWNPWAEVVFTKSRRIL